MDQYEDMLGTYLVKLSSQELSAHDSLATAKMLHLINDFERISDHSVNLLESVEELREKTLEFSEEAKRELIVHNLRLVVYIARRFENTGILLEDLISIGTIGLMKAMDTYRLDKKIKLATYASRCIENEILMFIRKTAKEKTEVSLDEPINLDGDGNELLLGDILGTEEDVVFKPPVSIIVVFIFII